MLKNKQNLLRICFNSKRCKKYQIIFPFVCLGRTQYYRKIHLEIILSKCKKYNTFDNKMVSLNKSIDITI